MQWSGDPNAGFTTGTPWEPVNPDYPDVNVASESTDRESLLSFYRALIQLRNQHSALRVGQFFPVDADNRAVFASLRMSTREALLVVINLGGSPVSGVSLSLASSPLSGSYSAAPVLGEGPLSPLTANALGGFDAYRPVPTLPPFGVLVIQLRSSP
jgi:glycosidase